MNPALEWLAVALAPALAWGQSANTVLFEQLTDGLGAAVLEPTISDAGETLTFLSSADLGGANPEGNPELFVWDSAQGARQLTQTPLGVFNRTPVVAGDASFAVFASNADFAGLNADGSGELFELDLTSLQILQLTDHPAGPGPDAPSLSGDGAFLAFSSAADPLGTNPDGNAEIFRLERASGVLIQLTNSLGLGRQRPSVNGDGSRIVFASVGNQDGTNPNGNLEIQRWDAAIGQITAVTQNPTGLRSDYASIDAEGVRVAFVSAHDFTGVNALGVNVYFADLNSGALTLCSGQGPPKLSSDPTISPDGSFVAFESGLDLVGRNPDGSLELFAFETVSGHLRQLTDTVPGGLSPSGPELLRAIDIAANGMLAYRSGKALDAAASLSATAELRLFRGRPACTGTPFGEGGGPPGLDGGFAFAMTLETPFGSQAKLRVSGTDLLAAGLILVSSNQSIAPSTPLLPPVLIDLGQVLPTNLTFIADGFGSAQIAVNLASPTAATTIYLQAASVVSALLPVIQFQSSNALKITSCP